MELHTHTAVGAAIMVALALLGFPVTSPVFLFLFLASCSAPDLDLIFGLGQHRKGTHTLLFAAIYGAAMVYIVRLLAASSVSPVAALVCVIFFIKVVYYKGRLRKAANVFLWTGLLALLLAVEVGGATSAAGLAASAVPSDTALFAAAFGGCAAHLLADGITASGDSRMKWLWPLQRRYGVRVLKTGQWGERCLYDLLTAGVFLAAAERGTHIRSALARFVPADSILVAVLALSVAVGVAAAYTASTKRQEGAVVR